MQFVSRKVPRNFNVFFIGDWHIGASTFHEDGAQQLINAIQRPYDGVKHNVGIGMGDYIEAIDTLDKRFDFDNTDLRRPTPEMQIDHFIEMVRPIRKQLAVLLYGNHEHKLNRYCDYTAKASKDLGIPYGTTSSIVSFMGNNGLLFKVYATHGNGSINSTADSPERRRSTMLISLKRKLADLSGDCAVMCMGHTHKLMVSEPEHTLFIRSDGNRLVQDYIQAEQNARYLPPDHRWYINTGSMLKLFGDGHSNYAERAMYSPLELGYAVLRVRSGKIVGVDRVIVD
jgi:hypothetical protein